jgi:DNA-directed RNA polymerase subunit alpha
MPNFDIACVESRIQGPRDYYSKFTIGPLDKGQGTTLGNALRRTLLSDLEGAAIVAVRIAGVSHEFSTIPGVREDVLEILLNLKEIIFRTESKEPTVGRLTIQGPTIVTTGNFDLPSGVSVIDENQYIATICGNNTLEMEFRIETNKGYQLIERGTNEPSIDFLHVDAVFMPVRKVSYKVEDSRQNSELLQEELKMEIWTNGSITPHEAISEGASILTELFSPLKEIDFKSKDNEEKSSDTKVNQILIEELQLSVRAYNCLKRAQIHSVADLLDYSQEDLIEIKNFGQKSAEDVIDALQKRLGINLPKERTLKSM